MLQLLFISRQRCCSYFFVTETILELFGEWPKNFIEKKKTEWKIIPGCCQSHTTIFIAANRWKLHCEGKSRRLNFKNVINHLNTAEVESKYSADIVHTYVFGWTNAVCRSCHTTKLVFVRIRDFIWNRRMLEKFKL